MNSEPIVSVIVPIHNGSEHFTKCLDALVSSSYLRYEIILVDDCSTDGTVSMAKQRGFNILTLQNRSGPAAARNFGARHARGEILLFVDSDITIRKETIASVVENFKLNPDIVSLFGSYDDRPAECNFISQYKNLFHHFHHQHANSEASTFWTGCGAILKKIYDELGGFDSSRYEEPSIEDIEFGYRIRMKGHKILLDKKLQVKHLKRWTLLSLLRADIFKRAIPWSQLILETKFLPKDLNLKLSDRLSSLCVFLMTLLLPFSILQITKNQNFYVNIGISLMLLILFLSYLLFNKELYKFFLKKKGLAFALKVIPFHILYYLYSGISFIYCWIKIRICKI